MLAAPPHIAQEEWKSDDRDDRRGKRHYNAQSKLHACSKTTLHRRRLSKGRRTRRWCWHGGGLPKENKGPPVSTSDSSSDTDVPRASVLSSGFENSAMKTSFSLSSLPPSSASLEGKQHAADRQFFSLRKKPRRDEGREFVRRSWGSKDDNKDEFWAALENNYLYLMDSNLIDTCKEAGQEAEGDGCPNVEWSFSQFTEQFSKLSSWLDNIQEAANTRSKSLYEEMQRNAYKRKVFNNQSGRLVARSPELKEEIAWRVSYLNSKWERLEQLTLRTRAIHRPDLPTDIEHELRCLRKWIKETEKRLQPLDFKTNWTLQQLEEKAKEQEVVQKDVWLHGRAVCRLVKQCEDCGGDGGSLNSWVRGRRLEPSQAATYARGLERRWQLLYLASLEWQCHIETLTKTARLQEAENPKPAVLESDEEPVSKHPRLTDPPVIEQEDEVDQEVLMDTSEGECEDMEVEQRSLDVVVDQEVPSESNQDNLTILLGQSLSPSVVRRLFLDETSKFNRSDRNGPNCATFYFKHLDTESEAELGAVEGAVSVEGGPKSTVEESSEEEWTYTVTQDSGTATVELEEAALEAAMMASLGGLEDLPDDDKIRPRKEMIAKLVEKAEEMILEEVCASPARKRASRVFEPHRIIDPHTNTKYTRVKEWLQLHPDSKVVGDSCDASGETTEEEGSVGGVSDQLDTTLKDDSEPRVVLRHKRPSGPRPSSFSTPSGLLPPSPCLPNSISEPAIHQLAHISGGRGQMDSSANNVSTLSSSTVEESTLTQDAGSAGGYSSNSLRRRKVKLRKRSLMRKSESCGSEGVLGASDATLASPIKLPTLAKLAMRRASGEKPNDSSARKCVHTVLSGNSSGSESESEGDGSIKHQKVSGAAPSFRLGPAHTLCSYASDRKDGKIVSADSSFSETAWDNYQEKYMSEAYSEEAADSEAARRILDFGDDYRTFLDSQSDCASSLGPPQLLMRKPARRQTRGGESDSEMEDVWHLVRQSQSQLFFSEKVFNTLLSRASPHLVFASDFAELVTTCKNNISVLTQMLEKIEEGTALLSAEECNDIRELISQWERLEKGAEELQRERSLKREMAALREELLEMAARSAALETDLEDRDQLELRIQEVKGELSRLRDVNKSQLFQVNLAVHRFLTDCPSSNSVLKDQVADLYRLWDDTFHRACGRLRSLEEAGAAWIQFERHLSGLQAALRGDQEALALLRAALARGPVPPDMASGLRDIARLLSEKSPGQEQAVLNGTTHTNLETSVSETAAAVVRELGGSAEGSLSDSGISDSGSEQELSERERRLSALRRLVRHLEAVLAPNSQAIVNMSKRLQATEMELRGLQQTCRDLIVKTAVSVEAKGRLPAFIPPVCDSTNPEYKKGVKSGPRWLVRVLRAALPFHLALVALFCIACLLQPHCCDSLNNLNLSFMPQLRYLKGPPPV